MAYDSPEKARAYYVKNREKIRARERAYRENNPEKIREQGRVYRENNREKLCERGRVYRKNNPNKIREIRRAYEKNSGEEIRMKRRAYYKLKRGSSTEFRIRQNLRVRLRRAIRGSAKSARTLELLGMEVKEFKIYVQGQFQPGMTWENYGPVWHLDHVRPCASFDLTRLEQQKTCFNWSNLQPLFAFENLSKGAKYA